MTTALLFADCDNLASVAETEANVCGDPQLVQGTRDTAS